MKKNIFFLLILGISVVSFNCQNFKSDSIMTVSDKKNTYLALGDSYTIGESVPEADRWSMQLTDLLKKEGIILTKPDIIAQTGWTTAELAEAIKNSGNTKKYTMVSLLIGVNNQYRGQSLERYRTELQDLLKTAIQFADNKKEHVFMLSIPDWGVTPFAQGRNLEKIAKEIDVFNAIAADECKQMGIAFIDITSISRSAAGDNTMVASDNLHFSGKMYKLWAEKALPNAKNIIQTDK
jgi:lysophospholipase L1-like esterase